MNMSDAKISHDGLYMLYMEISSTVYCTAP